MHPKIETQAHLAAIIASSDDAITSEDLQGNIASWNPGAERIFGYTPDEVIGRHVSLLIPPEYLSDEDFILEKIKKGEHLSHFEATRRAKDGHLVNLSITVSPIKDREGRIIGASKIARDTTEIRAAERANAYLGAIIQSSDDAIISKDLRGFVTSWNSAAERMFGFKSDEIVGKHITLIIPSERLAEEDKILATLKKGDRIDHFETVRRRKDGSAILVSLTVSPIRDSAGRIVGASKVSRDISDRAKIEAALVDMAKRKDDFIANMSHELRTPMNAVIGLANLLQASKSLPEKERKFVETLKVSADSLLDLINDLLDFAKIESGAVELENIEFNLTEQIEKAISLINVRAQEKGLKLSVTYQPGLNKFYKGDPMRVRQMLMNLLSNAVKFTEHGSVQTVIGLGGEIPDATMLTIEVRDTGIGIVKSKLGTIFDKFTQADSSINRRFGGSGLGLAITKALAERMGGSIAVESEPGVGSVFTLRVPLGKAEQLAAITAFQPDEKVAPPAHKNVLLVDDYEPNVLVAGSMLDHLGYNYDIAHNGLEALKKFTTGKYDLILMDVQMHELDGLEATRKIRKLEKDRNLPHTPIIAMTAHVRERDKYDCIKAGMDDFIPKPFHPSELSVKLAHHMTAEDKELEIA